MIKTKQKPSYAVNKPQAYQHKGGEKRTHEQFVLEFQGMWGDVYALAAGERYTGWNVKMKFWDSMTGEYFYRNANQILHGNGNAGFKRGLAHEYELNRQAALLPTTGVKIA